MRLNGCGSDTVKVPKIRGRPEMIKARNVGNLSMAYEIYLLENRMRTQKKQKYVHKMKKKILKIN